MSSPPDTTPETGEGEGEEVELEVASNYVKLKLLLIC